MIIITSKVMAEFIVVLQFPWSRFYEIIQPPFVFSSVFSLWESFFILPVNVGVDNEETRA